MRFITTHTQPLAVKRESIPIADAVLDPSATSTSCTTHGHPMPVQSQVVIVVNYRDRTMGIYYLNYACSQSKKQPWRSHSNAICGDWVAKHKRTTRNGIGNCSSKTGSRRQSEKKTILKHFLKGSRRKITSAKMEKICWQITVAAFMQPLQYDLRSPAAKDNSITHAATAWSNLDTAITMRSAETELQNTIELRATASEIVAPKPDGSRRQSEKKTILKHFLRGFLEGKSLAPKMHFVRDFLQNSLTQPFQCDLRRLSCKTQENYAQRRRKL